MKKFLATALVTGSLLVGTAYAGPLVTAIQENANQPPASSDQNLIYARMQAAGARVVRVNLAWAGVAPAKRPVEFDASDPSDPGYRWAGFDAQLRLARAHGLQPLVVVTSTPPWARVSDGNAPRLTELRAFASAAARRYSGGAGGLPRVRYWQVWNEPNINIYLTPQFRGGQLVAPTLYRAMVNTVADAVHAVHRDNLVIAGGQSPFTVRAPNIRAIGPMIFMRRMLCMSAATRPRPTCSARVRFDVWAHHPYTSGGPTHRAQNPDDASLGDLPRMRTLLEAAVRARHVVSAGRVRFWVTEFSWDTDPPDRKALPIRLQARWTAEALYRMWRVGIDLVTWSQFRDDPYPADPYQSGLYFRSRSVATDRAKPTLTAFRFPFVAYRRPGSIFFWGRTPAGVPGRVVVETRAGGGWRRLAAIATDRYGIFTRTVRTSVRDGYVRARLVPAGGATLPFSLRQPPDRFVPPFG